MNHGADDEFWAPANILADPAKYKDIPVYLVGGWYDSWAGNTTANYAALSRTLKSPVYLMMGPWIHGQQTKGVHGQVDFGDEAAIKDEWAWRKEWFDHWLKGQSNAVGSAAPFASKVRIFVMGTGDGGKNDKGMLRHGGSWRDEQEWPLARAVATPMYLHAGGGLQTEKPPAKEAATTYDYDPRDPVPTWAGTSPQPMASCSRARGTSGEGKPSGTGPNRCRFPPAVMCWCFRPNRLRKTQK
nr:CocE/NonD family hydrolase [Verrucomicrobium spinosum]